MTSVDARFLHQQAGLEVVPPETGLHPLPAHTPLYATTYEPSPSPKERPVDVEWGGRRESSAQVQVQVEGQGQSNQEPTKDTKRTILGLTVPVFWALIITLFIVLAAGIGGGVGGGLSAQQKSRSGTDASRGEDGNSSGNEGGSGSGSTSSSAAPSPTTSSTADSLVPTDGGCPGIHNLSYTPYSADGKPIPLETNRDPQEFREQCWTNWVNTASTHDILRTYTPTLENCITVCAEYNKAYAANLKNNNGVGGGPCVAVTIVKAHAGFCYLKNGTGTNDTMGAPNMYSSAVLVTS